MINQTRFAPLKTDHCKSFYHYGRKLTGWCIRIFSRDSAVGAGKAGDVTASPGKTFSGKIG